MAISTSCLGVLLNFLNFLLGVFHRFHRRFITTFLDLQHRCFFFIRLTPHHLRILCLIFLAPPDPANRGVVLAVTMAPIPLGVAIGYKRIPEGLAIRLAVMTTWKLILLLNNSLERQWLGALGDFLALRLGQILGSFPVAARDKLRLALLHLLHTAVPAVMRSAVTILSVIFHGIHQGLATIESGALLGTLHVAIAHHKCRILRMLVPNRIWKDHIHMAISTSCLGVLLRFHRRFITTFLDLQHRCFFFIRLTPHHLRILCLIFLAPPDPANRGVVLAVTMAPIPLGVAIGYKRIPEGLAIRLAVMTTWKLILLLNNSLERQWLGALGDFLALRLGQILRSFPVAARDKLRLALLHLLHT